MRVTYIGHSGFFVEMEDLDILFDYYRGEIPIRSVEKPLLVFVSHRHADHYNPEIFGLSVKYPDVRYVLSRDVPVKREIQRFQEQGMDLESRLLTVRKNSCQTVRLAGGGDVKIETFLSTDEGVAFLLEYGETTIYHAGDLNLWVWEGETVQYNEKMARAYRTQLKKLEGRRIDAAFLPLDPRQEQFAYGGMELFLGCTQTARVFPMHVWEQYEIIDAFVASHPQYAPQIQQIRYPGQRFVLEERMENRDEV